MRQATIVALALLGSACASLPAHVGEHPDRIHWSHEPTICISPDVYPERAREVYAESAQDAIDAYGVGVLVDSCEGADIRIQQGALTAADGGAWGRATWPGERGNACDVFVKVYHYVIIPHELGHCFGLDHSTDRRSVMYATVPSYGPDDDPRGTWIQLVTREDRELAQALIFGRSEI